MGTEREYDPAAMYHRTYGDRITGFRMNLLEWFHRNRLDIFRQLIDETEGVALSVGCSTGEFEKGVLEEKFETVVGLELDGEAAREAGKLITTVQANACSLPFASNSFEAVVGAAVIEHVPDQEQFLEDVHRCLRSDGVLYLTAPVEVGFQGLCRFLARQYIYGDHDYLGYTLEELTKSVPREKHGTVGDHRYYNYQHLLDDLERDFEHVTVIGWPSSAFIPTLILNIKAVR